MGAISVTILTNNGFARLWRTVRYLKPEQILGRIRFRLSRPMIEPAAAPSLRQHSGPWQQPATREASLVGPSCFCFLNEEADLALHGWDDSGLPKLWRYNQHYFDDLNAQGAHERRDWHAALIDRWVTENPPPKGSGWEPYPTSLRIVNWVKFALGGNQLSDAARQSLAVQVRWLRKRLEWHLLGNHLFANAKALVFAGLFFDGEEAGDWLRVGLSILQDQILEQILADGAQFELSPMYHALALEDVLDLVNLARTFGCKDLALVMEPRVPAMLDWLLAMSHPDGEIAFFNDAAMKVAPNTVELLRFAQDLGFAADAPASGLTLHRDSGYVRMAVGSAIVIADLARVGPDYLPGHAHADTLSFELSVHGKRVIVNSGTSEYGTGPERQRQRGTAAHSTLILGGENSSEVWSGFRVGRRAKPHDVATRVEEANLVARGAHDGYKHLTGSPIHSREWRLKDGRLLVTDSIDGSGNHLIEAYFHLGPGIRAAANPASGQLELTYDESGHKVTFSANGGLIEVIPSSWHPEFGRTVATDAIRVSVERSLPHSLQCELAWCAQ